MPKSEQLILAVIYVVMNPFPFVTYPKTSAPIPHQFAMKVYVDTWIYVTEKYANMGFIELYKGILRYETGI